MNIASNYEEHSLNDPDRPMKNVVPPPMHPLPHNQLFKNSIINLKKLKSHLRREGRLLKEDAMYLASTASEIFRKEPNLLILTDPITVCGDIHGQFFDLLRLLDAAGDPKTTQYLFLGDYVDRGCFSSECVFLLLANKIRFPKTFWMLRGNHECRHLTSYFNFKDECIYKYDEEIYHAIMNTFDCLPIAATINGKFMACHGGLSPDISDLDDISTIDRFQEIPKEGPFCDLVWADPVAEDKDKDEDEDDSSYDVSVEEDLPTTWFSFNETRQCSYVFGIDAVTTFLDKNNLTAIIRAHEACYDGYKFLFISEETEVPRVITIFSAPNYCDVYKNKAACLKFENDILNIRQFVSSPHPYYLPNFMDVITWSMPFVAEKVCGMLTNVLSFAMVQERPVDDLSNSNINDMVCKQKRLKEKAQRMIIIKDKILAITKMKRFYNIVQEENENILKLKALSPSGRLPAGILSQGSDAIANAVSSFTQAQIADKANMQLPGPAKDENENSKLQFGFRTGMGIH